MPEPDRGPVPEPFPGTSSGRGTDHAEEATILHADLDAFYASVEQRDDPRLRGRPVIVGAGVVVAASYEAKAYGIHTAMNGREARRRCPDVVVVPPRMTAYADASKTVFEVFEQTTPMVEALSIDEAFLEVGGLRRIAGPPMDIATQLRRDVRERVGLPITVGVARTKFLAKVASAEAKPDGLVRVPPEDELAFLHPLPVERLWGAGTVTARKLRARGLITIADVAQLAESTLVSILGPSAGRHLHALAQGHDPRRVRVGKRRRSVGAQRALGRTHRSPAELASLVVALVDRLTRRLRTAHRLCRTVVLRFRFADFARASRSHTLAESSARTEVILAVACELLTLAMPMIERRGLTLLGVALTNLDEDSAVQLPLPFAQPSFVPGSDALDSTLDRVRDRFGSAAVTRAVLLGRDQEPSVPLLPD